MDESGRVFKVVHADGSEWTHPDIERWAIEHDDSGLVWCDMDGFLIDEYGCLMLADECGNFVCLGESDEMKVVYMEVF